MIQQADFGKLTARVFHDRFSMAESVVRDVTKVILTVLESKDSVNMLFAAAPSQKDVLEGLRHSEEIPWDRINAFHMDEYIGLDKAASQGFGNFLDRVLFSHVAFRNVFYIDGSVSGGFSECDRYTALLREHPLDIALLGIGENGHMAFNDPSFADFNDPLAVKVVELDQICRQQQVNDGCFINLDDVPEVAITLTIPELIKPGALFCTVPGSRKEMAVRRTLTSDISETCPASVLRTVKSNLYLDRESGACLL